MSKIEELLALSDENPEAFDDFAYSVSDTIESPPAQLVDVPYVMKKEFVAGYDVSYAYRLTVSKLQDGGEHVYAEVVVFTVFNFLGKAIIDNLTLMREIKYSIADKLKKAN